jgi:hypothetical protein
LVVYCSITGINYAHQGETLSILIPERPLGIRNILRSWCLCQSPYASATSSNTLYLTVEKALSAGSDGYRLENSQRRIQEWIGLFPQVSTTGGRSRNDAPLKYYNQWADSSVAYRLDLTSLNALYYEDAPQVVIPTVGGDENFYSSMCWMDWYGAIGTIIAPPLYPQWQTQQGYATRPQFFDQYSETDGLGTYYFFKYPNSSPITIQSAAVVVAVPFQSGDTSEFYIELLNELSTLNINSQSIIPVKISGIADLAKFDSAIVDYTDY